MVKNGMFKIKAGFDQYEEECTYSELEIEG